MYRLISIPNAHRTATLQHCYTSFGTKHDTRTRGRRDIQLRPHMVTRCATDDDNTELPIKANGGRPSFVPSCLTLDNKTNGDTHCLDELSWVKRRLRLPPGLLSVFAFAFPRRRRSEHMMNQNTSSVKHMGQKNVCCQTGAIELAFVLRSSHTAKVKAEKKVHRRSNLTPEQ